MRLSRKTLFALAFYILVPTGAIVLTMFNYPELSRTRFIIMLDSIIPVGLVLVAISQYETRYAKGSRETLALDVAYTLVALLWVVALLGGRASITQTWNGYEFTIDIWKKLLLVVAVAGVNLVYYGLVYVVYREDVPGELEHRDPTVEEKLPHPTYLNPQH